MLAEARVLDDWLYMDAVQELGEDILFMDSLTALMGELFVMSWIVYLSFAKS